MDLTPKQQDLIVQWAEKTSSVLEVRLFGSYAKGCARCHSDVDLALALEGDGIEDLNMFYIWEWREWRAELGSLLCIRADVQLYHKDQAPNVYRYCQEASVLLYSRHA